MANGFGPDAPRNPFDPFGDRDFSRDARRQRRSKRQQSERRRIAQEAQRRVQRENARRLRTNAARRAAAAKSGILARIARAGRILNPAGAIIAAAGVIADAVAEIQRQTIDDEVEAANARLQRKIARRAKEAVLRTTRVRGDIERPGAAEQLGDSPTPEIVLPGVGPIARPEPERIQPRRPVEVDPLGRPDIPAADPAPSVSPGPGRRVGPGTVQFPRPTVTPRPRAAPSSAPVRLPELATPGFGSPEAFQAPVGDPRFIAPPVQFPVFRPVGDVFSPPAAPRLPDNLTRFQDDPLQFPQPNPQPDPARQRCKPCKEDNPEPRERCFKGLYREGRLDTQVDFTEWAEINCETGVEI